MSIDYDDPKYKRESKYVYPPRIGETAEFEIKELKEVTDGDPRFHYRIRMNTVLPDGSTATVDKNLGYHHNAILTNGKILSITSKVAFDLVFVKYKINDGDKVRIEHENKNIWKITKL